MSRVKILIVGAGRSNRNRDPTRALSCSYALSRSALAADTIDFNFSHAVWALFNGRLENVPKPQSGFRKILSIG